LQALPLYIATIHMISSQRQSIEANKEPVSYGNHVLCTL